MFESLFSLCRHRPLQCCRHHNLCVGRRSPDRQLSKRRPLGSGEQLRGNPRSEGPNCFEKGAACENQSCRHGAPRWSSLWHSPASPAPKVPKSWNFGNVRKLRVIGIIALEIRHLENIGPNWAQPWSISAKLWPMSSKLWSISTTFGRLWPNLGRLRSTLGQARSNFGPTSAKLGRSKAEFGHVWWPKFGQVRS